MSRTIRRSNFFLTSGFSTYSWLERHHFTYDSLYNSGNGHEGCPIYRPMTEQEINKMKKDIFCDTHSNAFSPGRSYRQHRETELRTFNRRELIRWKQREDYEPMCAATPVSCLWDWD